jgi:hypothetical protein
MLKQVMGQSDKYFSAILTKIGSGLPLDEEEIRTVESRFRTRDWCDDNVKDAVRLYHDNRSVDECNLRDIPKPDLVSIAKDLYTWQRNNDELVAARTAM